MNGKYIMAAVNMLIVTVGLCVLELTKFDGVAALIFILPMVAETLEATADYTMQKQVCTKIIDIISFICSCGTTILIICYIRGAAFVTQQEIQKILLIYPFYKAFLTVKLYIVGQKG